MQSVRLFAPHDLRLVERPEPQPGPGEITVQVEAAGLCGTDRHLFKGEFPCTPPVTLGHEFSGRIIARGEGVTLPLGAGITCDPNISCGTCAQCRRGRVNLCAANIAIGIHRDGGFAQQTTLPAHRAHLLPDALNPLHGAFCEPLACTLHALDMAAVQPGERVIVMGGGVIGLLALQLAKLAGAEVMLQTRQRAKQELALSLGASQTAATPQAALAIWPEGADVVLECAGVAETVTAAPHLTRSGGRVVILGVLAKGERVQIEPFDLLFREIQLHHAFLNPFTQSRAAALISDGRLQLDPLISRVIPLSDLPAAIANPPGPGEVKILAVPEN